MKRNALKLLLLAFSFYPASAAFAWGEIGHFIIALVASKMVQNPELKAFLKNHGLKLGHVANIPDISWRQIPNNDKEGENSHFINNGQIPLKDIPTDWNKLVEKVKKTSSETAIEHGSLWWRADQFQRLAGQNVQQVGANKPPSPAYDKAVFDMITNMGLLAHFVGDASMPWHNTNDYNGWQNGHGGIHGYYEEELVEALGLGLADKIRKRVIELQKEQTGPGGTLLEEMKALSLFSSAQLPELLALDKVSKPSDATDPKNKIKAERPAAEKTVGKFGPFIIDQLARSAVLLAKSWDQIYERNGKPDLTAYHSYEYPLAPAYVPVDYLGDCQAIGRAAPPKPKKK